MGGGRGGSAIVDFRFSGLLKSTGQYQNIQILNISPFCTKKYKHKFIDIDWTCEVDVDWTSACISQYKTRKYLVFDLLIFYLLFFLLFLLKATQRFPCDVVPRQSEAILKWYRSFIIFNFSCSYLVRTQTIYFLSGKF